MSNHTSLYVYMSIRFPHAVRTKLAARIPKFIHHKANSPTSTIATLALPGTALKNSATGEIVYTPPEGETLLRDLLANWERFLHNETTLDPLIRMAIGHYQFEAIHPFMDGNGRTGRVLNTLLLIQLNLLNLPILYLSRYIIQNKPNYHDPRNGSWTGRIARL